MMQLELTFNSIERHSPRFAPTRLPVAQRGVNCRREPSLLHKAEAFGFIVLLIRGRYVQLVRVGGI